MTRKKQKQLERLKTITDITIGLLMGLILSAALFLPLILN